MKTKRILAAAACAAVAFGMTGCSTPATVGAVGDVEIPSGLFLLYQQMSYNEAADLVEDPEQDVLKQQVEGVDAAEWIRTKTLEKIDRYVGIGQTADELGVELTAEQTETVQQIASSQWEAYEENYSDNGIGEESLVLAFTAEQKATLLLDAIYGPEGTEPVSTGYLTTYIKKNYAQLEYFSLPIMTSNYTMATDEQHDELVQMAKDAASKLMDEGADFATVATETVQAAYDLLEAEMPEDADALQTTIVSREGSGLDEATVNNIFSARNGAYGSADLYTSIIVYCRAEVEDTESLEESALSAMKSEELEGRLVEAGAALEHNLDEKAMDTFSVKKIKA